MIAFLRRRPFIAAVATLAVALAALLAIELADSVRPRIPAASTRPGAGPQAKLLPSIAAAPAEQAYPEVVARPLFTPTRRPAPAQASAAAPAFNRGQFQLLGVIIAGDTKTAMVREKASGKIHRVELGRELNGIKVATIERDTITLAQGGETEVLPLQVQKAAAGAAAPAVAGPFGAAAPGQPQPGMPPQPGVQPVPAQPNPVQIPPASAALLGIAPPGPLPPPQGGAVPQVTPMTPEELLARRRARRAQPNQ